MNGTAPVSGLPVPRISTATVDWLALRAAADDAARSRRLAEAIARALPTGPVVVHDLGSGTGAMLHWLAPRLPGPQSWVLHDGDAEILRHARVAGVRDADGGPVSVETRLTRLDALTPDALAGAGIVTASALLDVLTRDEVDAVVAACTAAGAPALLSLSVTGRVVLDPPEPDDGVLEAAFDDHQRRTADGRRLLGPDAPDTIADLFTEAGWRVVRDATPWRLGPGDAALIEAWLDGWIDAAVEQRPALAERGESARRRRRAQLATGSLAVVVHHEDVLAWPA